MRDEQGYIPIDGHRVWYRRVGSGGIPLLLLHGGPGAGHDYLEPLEGLARDHEVVFFDQLGCGRFDEIPPVCADTIRRGIADSRVVVFEHSGHTAHLEETQRYLQVVGDFSREIEAATSKGA